MWSLTGFEISSSCWIDKSEPTFWCWGLVETGLAGWLSERPVVAVVGGAHLQMPRWERGRHVQESFIPMASYGRILVAFSSTLLLFQTQDISRVASCRVIAFSAAGGALFVHGGLPRSLSQKQLKELSRGPRARHFNRKVKSPSNKDSKRGFEYVLVYVLYSQSMFPSKKCLF